MLKGSLILAALIVLVTATACGGDDSNDSSSGSGDAPAASDGGGSSDDAASGDGDDDAGEDDPQPVDSGGSSGGGVGFVEAAGQRFDVTEVRRCEPFFEGEGNLDLQARASDVTLFVTINTTVGVTGHELSIQGGDLGVLAGAGNSIQGGPWLDDNDAELPGPPFEVSGDRVSGSLQLADPRGSGDTLDVSFDIPIPDDFVC